MTGRLLAFLALGSLLIVLCCGCGAGQPTSDAAVDAPPPRPAFDLELRTFPEPMDALAIDWSFAPQ